MLIYSVSLENLPVWSYSFGHQCRHYADHSVCSPFDFRENLTGAPGLAGDLSVWEGGS